MKYEAVGAEPYEPPYLSSELRQYIGRLAVEMRLAYEDVLAWMEEQPWPPEVPHKPRKEDAPGWRANVDARNLFNSELDRILDLCSIETATGSNRRRHK